MTSFAPTSSGNVITLALEGVHCGGCVLKIEKHLASCKGVSFARGNATQRRLRIIVDQEVFTEDEAIREIENLGYGAQQIGASETTSHRSPLPQLAVAGFGTMNIMAFSFSVWAGAFTDMGAGTMLFMHWLSAAIALPVTLYSGAVFYLPALKALRVGKVTMDTPISLAIWVTFVASVFETIRGSEHVYFDAVVSLIFLLLIGRVLEHSLKLRSGDAAQNLRNLIHVSAHRVGDDGVLHTLDADALRPGDRILVHSGEMVPADGVLLSANGMFDNSIVTGETHPQSMTSGDPVIAGSVLIGGPTDILVTHVGEDAQIGRLSQIVEDVTAHKGRMQLMAVTFAHGYVPTVLLGGALGFLVWYFVIGVAFSEALMIAVAVLVVTCPCAAGLATPAVTSRAVNLLMKSGIIVKTGAALERLGEVNRIYLDKTGTASEPKLALASIPSDNSLQCARDLAANSSHPLAKALARHHQGTAAVDIVEHPGLGLEHRDGRRLGSAAFVGAGEQYSDGPSIWYRSADGDLTKFGFSEHARPGLKDFLNDPVVKARPVKLLSGDSESAVAKFAEKHGIEDWASHLSPEEKLTILITDRDTCQRSMMIGDGINDAAALSAAHVSVAFSDATHIAQSAADVVLVHPSFELILKAMATAKQGHKLIRQNLLFSTVYNLVTVPLALFGVLTPLLAALLMSASSVIVLANGFRLRVG